MAECTSSNPQFIENGFVRADIYINHRSLDGVTSDGELDELLQDMDSDYTDSAPSDEVQPTTHDPVTLG